MGFCAGAQLAILILIFVQLDLEKGDTYYVSWHVTLTRLVCCWVFHFSFYREVQNSLRHMKYVLLNMDKFEHPM